MKRLLPIATILFLLMASCTTSTTVTTEAPTAATVSPQESETAIQATPKSTSNLDVIEAENSKMIAASGTDINKFFVDEKKRMFLSQDKFSDHRVFGYAKADISSGRLLLISIYTTDVEDNPFGCKLGAFYTTEDMIDWTITYVAKQGDFVEAAVIDASGKSTRVFFESKWLSFEG